MRPSSSVEAPASDIRDNLRFAFDTGVRWRNDGRVWTYSGWAFTLDGAPAELALEIGTTRTPLIRNIARPDVAAAYGLAPNQADVGFSGSCRVDPGTTTVRLLVQTDASWLSLVESTLIVSLPPLRFNVETPAASSVEAGPCRVSGWCFHPDEVIESLVVTSGVTRTPATYGLVRPDVLESIPEAPSACGFECYLSLPAGHASLALEARLSGGGRIGAAVPLRLRVRGTSYRVRIAKRVAALHALAQRAIAWREARGRWPHVREWPRLAQRARQELAFALRGGDKGAIALPQPIDRYEAWLAVNVWGVAAETRLRARLTDARGLPVISVVMPVHDPDLASLSAAIQSVQMQVYPNWELCIVDDRSANASIGEYLRQLAAEDARVRLRFRATNGNISVATNDAAALAAGDILLFLDHDDLLTPDCLAEIALAVAADPRADVLYSDDDKITMDGRRHSPQFKPDWSAELLLSYMYLSHALAVRRSLFDAVGGMRIGYEGSQDYDFALRATERARSIVHIPRILYHWRVAPGSTAQSGDAKPASFEVGRLAVQEALGRRRIRATVERPDWAARARIGVYAHDFPDEGPEVTIIIPTRNRHGLLKQCLDSLALTTYRNYRVLVVDNESDDPATLSLLHACGHEVLRVASPEGRFNFAHLNNVAVRYARTEFVLLLNNDTKVIEPRWLSRMVGYASLPGVGAVGARLLHADGTLQHAGIVHGYYDGLAGPAFKNIADDDAGYLCYARVARNYSAVTAACMLTPRLTFLALGGFDEKRFGVAYNDVDYGYRLHTRGLRCVLAAGAELFHLEGATRGYSDEPRELAAFKQLYRARRDPFYSPHLSLDREDFAIRPVHFETANPPGRVRALMCAFNLNWEGAPYSQFELTRELARRGVIDPVVFSPVDGPLRASYEEAGIAVHVRPHPLAGCMTAEEYDAAVNAFADWAASLDVAVVYGNTLQTFYAIDAAQRLGIPSLWNPRESEPWREYFRGFGPQIELRALRCFAYPYRIIFVARATARVFAELDSHHNFCVIHNGLDPAVIARDRAALDRGEARQRLAIADGEVGVLLLGTVCQRKGQHDAVLAWAALAESAASKARLFIVGDRPGAYSSELRAHVAELPPKRRDRIHIVEETGDVASYFGAADAFLCTSRIESYPRVILEAMSWHLPIVTTAVFGIAEQVRDEVNALIYPPGQTDELARQLGRIIVDDALRLKLTAHTPDVLATLNDFEQMTDKYARLFEEASLLKDAARCAA